MKLLEITIKLPCDKGFSDEKQIVTEDSTSHELLRNWAFPLWMMFADLFDKGGDL